MRDDADPRSGPGRFAPGREGGGSGLVHGGVDDGADGGAGPGFGQRLGAGVEAQGAGRGSRQLAADGDHETLAGRGRGGQGGPAFERDPAAEFALAEGLETAVAPGAAPAAEEARSGRGGGVFGGFGVRHRTNILWRSGPEKIPYRQ